MRERLQSVGWTLFGFGVIAALFLAACLHERLFTLIATALPHPYGVGTLIGGFVLFALVITFSRRT